MFLKFTFAAIVCCSFSVFAQTVNPHFDQYKQNISSEFQKKQSELKAKAETAERVYRDAAEAAKEASSRPGAGAGPKSSEALKSLNGTAKVSYDQYKAAQAELKSFGVNGAAPQIYTNANEFANDIASDLKSSSGPKVVGFLAGFSSAGHDAGVIDSVNTMQKAAAQYFNLNANSSYGLINGASVDGGINEQFDKAVKAGTFTPAVDAKNFKSYGAVSVNIGEWGGMMTTNKSVLLADSPAGNYEMKATPQSASQNPLSLAQAAKAAGANVHIMLTEGGEIGLKEVLEYINNEHKSGTKALIHLGIGYDGTNPAKDKGMRGASFLARHLALHPELIDSLEKNGIKFMAVDANSGRHYSSMKEYLKSNDWKTQLLKFSNANKEIKSDDFSKKKAHITELEEKLKTETDKDKKKQLNNQIGTLKGEVGLVENRVNSEGKIAEYVGELSKISSYKSGSGPLERVAKASASAVEASRRSGVTIDPAEAARAATKGVK